MQKTALGLPENVEALLTYVFGFLTGFLFLLIEKENQFVRFHAMQSLSTFITLFVASFAVGFVPIIGWMIGLLLVPVNFILWIFLMYKAFIGERYALPVIGAFVEKQLGPPPA